MLLDKVNEVARREYRRLLDAYWYAGIASDDWTIEDRDKRQALPEFKVIAAAPADELTLSEERFDPSSFRDWHRSNGGPGSTRFSSLSQINTDTVKQLHVAWTYRSGTGNRNIQSNPVIADGLLFTATGGHDIVALNAATGKEIWKFHPGFDYPAKRGMIWWPGDGANGPRLYFAAWRRLFALNPRDGSLVEAFGGGSVDIGSESRIAPVIAGNKIVTATMKPSVHGFDLHTGKLLWSTDLIPENLPAGPGGKPSRQAGGGIWGGMAVDQARGIAYVSTGNPGPVLVGVDRPGPNPNSVSVVALDIKDGGILWSFQEVAHDLWDLDIAASPVLTTVTRNGRRIDVVAAVTKTGNTLLLDRVSGKPIFDFRLRRAPTSILPGERTAEYQPDVELPEPFAKQAFTLEGVTNIGEQNRRSVLDQLNQMNYGFFVPHEEGVETVFFGLHGGAEWPGAAADPRSGMLYVASNHVPSMATVVNVAAALEESGSPETPGRKVYLQYCAACHGEKRQGDAAPSLLQLGLRFQQTKVAAIIENGTQSMARVDGIAPGDVQSLLEYLYTRDKSKREVRPQSRRSGDFRFERTEYRKLVDDEGYPASKPPWGTLNALNLNTGKIAWRVPLGEYPELTAKGIPVTGTENFAGPMVTAGGLVFASGTKDRTVRGFDANTGEELWRHELPFIGSASPSTYEIDGRQFLVVPATGGGTLKLYDDRIAEGDAIVAFALPR